MDGYEAAMAQIRQEANKTIDGLNMQDWDSGVAQLKFEALNSATAVYLALLDERIMKRQLDDGAAYIKAQIQQSLAARGVDIDFSDDELCDE